MPGAAAGGGVKLVDVGQWDPPAEPENDDPLLAAFARVLREAEEARPILRVIGREEDE